MKGSKKTQRRRTRKQRTYRRRGGSLTGAPLTYGTVPGANVAVYGRFPTEIMTDPASIKNLDVFYNSGLSHGCGTENTTLTVPTNMGENTVQPTVGGRRRRGGSRKGGKGRKSGSRKTLRRRKNSRGGGLMDMFDTTAMRPYMSTAYPNLIQSAHQMWSGQTRPVPYPSTPVYHTWKYANYTPDAINPNKITAIASDFDKLAYSK